VIAAWSAIAACHAQARTTQDTDWARITALYNTLVRVLHSILASILIDLHLG
jgi:predicted RNA polymerase sigma factor